eukprot:TRINITY_DN311_c0_g1_i2.p1 TRINITY_DN311_c0_g1~~TRINITY_DN311_c0_g1_i2.p1  ORF type:complete len:377 (-),score=56.14 TRINITY_DN311_c0_g1_i2:131-1261(-)
MILLTQQTKLVSFSSFKEELGNTSLSYPSLSDSPLPTTIPSKEIATTCDLGSYSLVSNMNLRACKDDSWNAYIKIPDTTLYLLMSATTTLCVVIVLICRYYSPRIYPCLLFIAVVAMFIVFVVVARNNIPSAGAEELFSLRRLLNGEVTFLYYRAQLGLNVYLGGMYAKEVFAVEPDPVVRSKLEILTKENTIESVKFATNCFSTQSRQRNITFVDSDGEHYAKVDCVILPDFVSSNSLAAPLLIYFNDADSHVVDVVASWKPWLKKIKSGEKILPVLYLVINHSSAENKNSTQLDDDAQDFCDILNDYDFVWQTNLETRAKLPLTPKTLCDSCSYIAMDQKMAKFYRLGVITEIVSEEGNTGPVDAHQGHDGHGR